MLTDPDFPGLKIRNKITENIENVNHAYIDKEQAIKLRYFEWLTSPR